MKGLPTLLSLFLIPTILHSAEPPATTASDWKGFIKQSFDFEGHKSFVVVPQESAPGKPWVWRTSFPDFHAEVDIELVKGGFHVAHVDVVSMLGSDESLAIMDRFYELVRQQWGLSAKPALEAVSRGGLHAYRYAATRPERVACIYADTPVMDLKSWPLKSGKAKGPLADALKFYGFVDEARSSLMGEGHLTSSNRSPARRSLCVMSSARTTSSSPPKRTPSRRNAVSKSSAGPWTCSSWIPLRRSTRGTTSPSSGSPNRSRSSGNTRRRSSLSARPQSACHFIGLEYRCRGLTWAQRNLCL